MPLRKGSKGIPGKNTRLFLGKPLFTWYVETILKAGNYDQIWVATNCDKVKKIINECYSDILIFDRSEESAQDTSPTIDVVLEFLKQSKCSNEDNLILVQATSPLTSVADLKGLFQQIEAGICNSFLACLRTNRFRWSEDGKPLNYRLTQKPRRQDYRGFLIETGAFYCSKVGDILRTQQLISGNIGIVEVGQQSIIDIDEPVDWCLEEAYLSFLQENL